MQQDRTYRKYITKELLEFLKKPEIYIKNEYMDKIAQLSSQLGEFEYNPNEKKSSQTLIFKTLKDREKSCYVLLNNSIRFRTGKTSVPFRLTTNLKWGVPVPETLWLKDLSFYVWPESLWAPISFTKTYLNINNKESKWQDWWCSKDSQVYQFIGEDNLYFYTLAQMGIFYGMQAKKATNDIEDGDLRHTRVIANKHILFLNKKASSSGNVKAPMAEELLQYYGKDQLRTHFLSLGLGNDSVSFMPKVYNPLSGDNDLDPVLKEGNLFANVYNRIARSLFYTAEKIFNNNVPSVNV